MSFTLVEYKSKKILIFDSPSDKNAHIYIEELNKLNVKHILRVCDPYYDITPFTNNGIEVITMPYKDGDIPPIILINKLLELVNKYPIIGIHCVAGLGRAPVLTTIALIEYGMEPLDAVKYVRDKRRGSINSVQLKYLINYKKQKNKCSIM